MLSAVIRNGHSYRAVPLAGQLVHHRSAHPGPLVLGATPLNSPARTLDRDRTVSQRSEPSSRTALMGEQPNPWEVLPPQDATSRHRAISAVTDGADYLSTFLISERRCRRLMAITESLPQKQIAISPLSWISRYRVMPGTCNAAPAARVATRSPRIAQRSPPRSEFGSSSCRDSNSI